MAELSSRVVGQLGTGEQLLLWALRQRRADRGLTTPQLVEGFRLACGLAGVEPALACFERLSDALADEGRCRLCPLRCALVGSDEAACLGLVAAAQRGLRGQQAQLALSLVGAERAAELVAHAGRMAEILSRAGHCLSAALPAASATLH